MDCSRCLLKSLQLLKNLNSYLIGYEHPIFTTMFSGIGKLSVYLFALLKSFTKLYTFLAIFGHIGHRKEIYKKIGILHIKTKVVEVYARSLRSESTLTYLPI